MITVDVDPVRVEQQLRAGRLTCPDCRGRLAGWGHARRRRVHAAGQPDVQHPRRARCVGCARTHVLLPVSCLARRADSADVIWSAIVAKAHGIGHRPIAARLGRPASTVRDWLARFAHVAEQVRAAFTVLAHTLALEPPRLAPAGSPVGDAVAAVTSAWTAARRRFAGAVVRTLSPAELASSVTRGLLLMPGLTVSSINTNSY